MDTTGRRSSDSFDQTNKIERIAIIGSGIAGLACAACIRHLQTGVKEIAIFDSNSNLNHRLGGSVQISSGKYALEQIGCWKEFIKSTQVVNKLVYTYKEDRLLQLELNDENKIYNIQWSTLRKILYDCAFKEPINSPSEDTIDTELKENIQERSSSLLGFDSTTKVSYHANKLLVLLREDDDSGKVSLGFSDGSVEYDYDLVIGADGHRSFTINYTAHPQQTILASLSIHLRGSACSQVTGLRVAQCSAPVRSTDIDFEKSDEIRIFSGNKCTANTFIAGEPGKERIYMNLLFREDTAAWMEEMRTTGDGHREFIKNILRHGDFDESHDLQRIVEACIKSNDYMLDVAIKDHALPLRSWSSESGRVILAGDSAHAMAPFLHEGCNQALLDAVSLALLIYEVNRGEAATPKKRIAVETRECECEAKPSALCQSAQFAAAAMLVCLKQLFDLTIVKQTSPTSMQAMAYKYEKIRKFPVTLIAVLGRMMRHIETRGGPVGMFIKHAVIKLFAITGLAKVCLTFFNHATRA